MRITMAAIAFLCVAAFDTASADMGALVHYRGDWMIDQCRKHLAATRWEESSESLVMRYAYRRYYCIRWTRSTWVMRYVAATDSYTASIRTGKLTETATGKWDQASKTMTWTVRSPNADDPDGKPIPRRHVAHAFGDRQVNWKTIYVRRNGTKYEGNLMTWDVLVPFAEIKGDIL